MLSNSFYILITLILIYVIITTAIFLFQRKFIFHPVILPKEHIFTFPQDFEEFNIPTKDGLRLNALLFRAASSKGVVIYHHGNAGNLQNWATTADDFISKGYDVVYYDYRGYGKTQGKPTQKKLFSDALAIYDFVRQQYPEDTPIIQYGRSLGSCIAARTAVKTNAPLLILETPYYSMTAMAKKTIPWVPHAFILRFPLPTFKHVKKYTGPTYMFHGTHDELIPYKQAKKLHALNKNTIFITIEGATHSSIREYDMYHESLSRALEGIKKPSD